MPTCLPNNKTDQLRFAQFKLHVILMFITRSNDTIAVHSNIVTNGEKKKKEHIFAFQTA